MDCCADERILEVRNFKKKSKDKVQKTVNTKQRCSTYIKYSPSKRFKLGKYISYAWQCG